MRDGAAEEIHMDPFPLSEAFRAPLFRGIGADKNGFNLGRYNNFLEVFGDDKRLWFLPVSSR